jgi:chromosomal replication initiator protein
LIIDGVDSLGQTERAQEELFHFFDNARRAGVQLVFTADRAPHELSGFEDRLRTRLESGLVVDLTPAVADETLVAELDAAAQGTVTAEPELQVDDWFLNREKLLWHWPYMQDSLVQELD